MSDNQINVTLATRKSQLAVAQSQIVAGMLEEVHPECKVSLVKFSTKGDRTAGPLNDAGGKGLFTAELETALRTGEVDFAVHSAKDMPAKCAPDLKIIAVPPRVDARDSIVSAIGSLGKLPAGATIGTGSLRRAALIKKLRPDLKAVPIRGNVQTRLARAIGNNADLDAVILAQAGLDRSGLGFEYSHNIFPLDPTEFIPAGCQGLLAVQVCPNKLSEHLTRALSEISCDKSFAIFQAERSVLQALSASCNSCLAVHISHDTTSNCFHANAMVAKPDGSKMKFYRVSENSALQAAKTLTEKMLTSGAKKILSAD